VLARRAAVLATLVATSGCAVQVATDLDDGRANRVVALLDDNGIAATKSADPTEPGRFRVDVPGDQASQAVGVLADEGPAARDTPGVLEALGTSSLVPSPQAEHERVLAGVAGDLTRSLEGLDGVLSARVHLAVERADPLAIDGDIKPPSASVLIRYRGASVPLREDDVRRLVAFAVPGLEPSRVAVVYAAAAPPHVARELVRLGPFSATRETARTVRTVALLVLTVNIVLAGCLIVLWTRLRRLRADTPSSKARAAR
jgi:type III secretion protein J